MRPHDSGAVEALRLELVSGLNENRLAQVKDLLQHALDHDGYLPIGEHIYLKLRSGQPANFEQKLLSNDEAAGALLAYREQNGHDHETYPGQPANTEKLVGYVQLLAQPDNQPSRLLAELVVHPHLRGQGIAKKLLNRVLELGQIGRFEQVDLWAYHARQPAQSFASHVQLVPTRTLHHLRRPAGLELPAYELPEDLRLRPFEPGQDDKQWLALNRLVFADHPENGKWTQADLEMRFSQPWFDAADFLMLENQSGQLIGFNWTKRVPARVSDLYPSPAYPEIGRLPTLSISPSYGGSLGEIYVVGLHPDARGRKIGRGLTLLGLQHLRERGSDFFALYVDATNIPAVSLYYSLGFTLHHDDISYTHLFSKGKTG